MEGWQPRRDGRINLMHAVKRLMAHARHQPIDDLSRRFRLDLFLCMVCPRRQYRSASMTCEVKYGIVAPRLVAVGVRDNGFGIVGAR
jgi:hypothetical protein